MHFHIIIVYPPGIRRRGALGARASSSGGSGEAVASLGMIIRRYSVSCCRTHTPQVVCRAFRGLRPPPDPRAAPRMDSLVRARQLLILSRAPSHPGARPGSRPLLRHACAGVARLGNRLVKCVYGRTTPNIHGLPSPVMPRLPRNRLNSMRGPPVPPAPIPGGYTICENDITGSFLLKKDKTI